MFSSSKALFRNPTGGATPTTDPSFAYVPLLLNTTSTNGQQNNTFLDSGTANGGVGFTITRNGTPTQGSSTPYWPNGQWSNYFNGSSDWLSVPDNTAFALGSGDFTAECWIYPTSFANEAQIMGQWSGDVGGTTLNFALLLSSGSTGYVRLITSSNGSSVLFDLSTSTTSFTLTLNSWQHIAAVRNGTTFTIYVNGVSRASTTNASGLFDATNPFTIGAESNTQSQYFTGYISNARLVKGTAVYTGAFTPSTTPLTAITNTSLLTCQSNRFRDNSTNNFTITVTGTPRVQAFQPFSPTASYTTALYGGSGYFNGSTDYLTSTITAPNSSIVSFECWVYNLGLDGTQGNHYLTLGTTNYVFSHNTGGIARWRQQNDAGTSIFDIQSASGVLKLNQWQYMVGIRSGSNAALYVDGVRVGTATGLGATTATQTTLYVSSNQGSGRYTNGYLSNVRIQSGTLPSGYDPTSTTIAVPTTPLAAVTGTLFLGNMTNAGIYDAAVQNVITTVGDAQVSTTITAKWPPTSIKFDGTGDYLSVSAGSPQSLTFGTGNFTIEFWVYFTSNTGFQTLYDGRAAAGAYPLLYLNNGIINYYVGASAVITSVQPSTGVWIFMSLRRSSGTTQFFINGTQSGGNYTDSNNYLAPPTSGARVGANYTGSDFLFGYIQDFRVTKAARAATPIPTAAFPTR